MAENKPNTADEKKAVQESEMKKQETATLANETIKTDEKAVNNAVVSPIKEKAPILNVVQFEQAAEATKLKADKSNQVRVEESTGNIIKKEQESTLKNLVEKSPFNKKNDSTPQKKISSTVKTTTPPVQKDNKEQENHDLKEQKQKLEQELREKYNIPKSSKEVEPWVAPETEQVVRITHDKLHSFKDHPFNVDKETSKFKAFVSSIRAHGVTQPAVVRPDGKGKFEIISGHRRDAGSIEAEIPYTPCIIRELNDDQAIQQMVEDNVNNREITTMELARALKVQLDSIKHQGARKVLNEKDLASDSDKKIVMRSNEIVAERNGMKVKQVQRYIALNNLTPAMQEYIEGKLSNDGKTVITLGFTSAVEISKISPDNQDYIAVAIEGQASPSLSQSERLRELDKQNLLNPDIIDGILMEEKKEVGNLILTSQELSPYFGKEETPRQMKDQIIKLLEENKAKQQDISKKKKTDKEK